MFWFSLTLSPSFSPCTWLPPQVRFLFGVMMKLSTSAGVEPEGRRINPLEYTGQLVVGVCKFMQKCAARIAEVAGFNGGGWKNVKDFEALPGGKYEKRYGDEIPDEFEQRPSHAPTVGRGSLHPVTAQPLKYWEIMLFRDVAKPSNANVRCVTELMQHAVNEGNRRFADTIHADDWVLGHDALSQWWEKLDSAKPELGAAQEFLRLLGFADRQLRAEGDTNAGEGRYDGGLVGDSPELMPLDNNLFADLVCAIFHHVALTTNLGHDDQKKFLFSLPRTASSTVRRVWTLSPTSERIVQDIRRWVDALKAIEAEQGAVVRRLNRLRKGRRYGPYTDKPVHADCDGAIAQRHKLYDQWEKEAHKA